MQGDEVVCAANGHDSCNRFAHLLRDLRIEKKIAVKVWLRNVPPSRFVDFFEHVKQTRKHMSGGGCFQL